MNERNESSILDTNINWENNQTQDKSYVGGSGWVHKRYSYRYYDDIKNLRSLYEAGINPLQMETKTL